MTLQPSPGKDHSSLDDSHRDTEDQNTVEPAEEAHPVEGEPDDDDGGDDTSASGGQVSEAGGASLNAETNAGGADAVPDSHG